MADVMTEGSQDDMSVPDVSSATVLSPSTVSGGTNKPKRDMQAELLAWKQEKAARLAQQRATKHQNPQPFRVPRQASPVRTPLIPASENAPCGGATTKAQPTGKTPVKSAPGPARQALGERCTNTDSSGGAPFCARSVSPPAHRYKPAPRATQRTKTPEPKRALVPKTPEPKRPAAARAVSPSLARPTTSAIAPQPTVPVPAAAAAAIEEQADEVAPTAASSTCEELPAADEQVEVPVLSTTTVETAAEEVSEDSAKEPEPAADSEALGDVEDSALKPVLGFGPASPASSPPPPPPCAAALPPAGPPPELLFEPASRGEPSDKSSDDSSETGTAEEPAPSSAEEPEVASEPGADIKADDAAEAILEAPSPAPAGCAASPLALSPPTALPSPPQAAPASRCSLSAYLPAACPAVAASPSARTGGGLLAAYEERAEVPKMPPPSPATPSAALACAIATASNMPDCANAEAAEFARVAGAALGRLAMQDASAEPAHAAALPEESEEQRSPEAPLSPLSLESQSPRPAELPTDASGSADKYIESLHEVKLEA